eukprot:Rmarinus@m.13273
MSRYFSRGFDLAKGIVQQIAEGLTKVPEEEEFRKHESAVWAAWGKVEQFLERAQQWELDPSRRLDSIQEGIVVDDLRCSLEEIVANLKLERYHIQRRLESQTQAPRGPSMGDHMEHFLAQLDTICYLGKIKYPPGVPAVVLRSLNSLIISVDASDDVLPVLGGKLQFLIAHSLQQTSMRQAKGAKARKSPGSDLDEREELVQLVQSFCERIRIYPLVVVPLFFSPKTPGSANADRFVLFSVALRFLNDNWKDGKISKMAARATLCIVDAANKYEGLSEYIVNDTQLAVRIVEGMKSLKAQLPRLLEDGHTLPADEVKLIEAFILRLCFVNDCVSLSPSLIGEQIVSYVVKFVDDEVYPPLGDLAANIPQQIAALTYARVVVECLDHPLLRGPLVRHLLGISLDADGGASFIEDKRVALRRKLLFSQIGENEEKVAVASLRLFYSLLATRERSVYDTLALMDVSGLSPEVGGEKMAQLSKETRAGSVGFLRYLPRFSDVDVGVDDELYNEDAQQLIDTYWREETRKGKKKDQPPRPESEDVGPFLHALLGRLNEMLHNSMPCNGSITGIIALLLMCPDDDVEQFILAPRRKWVMGALFDIAEEINRWKASKPKFDDWLRSVRFRIQNEDKRPTKPSDVDAEFLTEEDESFLRGVFFFEEFLKELHSIEQMKIIKRNYRNL